MTRTGAPPMEPAPTPADELLAAAVALLASWDAHIQLQGDMNACEYFETVSIGRLRAAVAAVKPA